MRSAQGGFLHFIAQSDLIGQLLFALLIMMSVLSWGLIVLKAIQLYRIRSQNQTFMVSFRRAVSLDHLRKYIVQHASTVGPLGAVTTATLAAQQMYLSLNKEEQHRMGEQQDFLAGIVQKAINDETGKVENGLVVFGTIAATAPFIGLFGTVWGVYHALIEIGASGVSTLDQVATPVGEALVMTGIGLAVAVPAVVAYNWLMRRLRLIAGELEAFTYELLPSLLTDRIIHYVSRAYNQTSSSASATV